MLQFKPRSNEDAHRSWARLWPALRLAGVAAREFFYLCAGTAAIFVGLAVDFGWAVAAGIAVLIITITQLEVVIIHDTQDGQPGDQLARPGGRCVRVVTR